MRVSSCNSCSVMGRDAIGAAVYHVHHLFALLASLELRVGGGKTKGEEAVIIDSSGTILYRGKKGATYMARPIEATPVLKGKDARVFRDQMMDHAMVTPDRLHWLEAVARESKRAEKPAK